MSTVFLPPKPILAAIAGDSATFPVRRVFCAAATTSTMRARWAHELPDQLATLRSLTKWVARIERVEAAPAMIDDAFRQMLSGGPGPVAVAV